MNVLNGQKVRQMELGKIQVNPENVREEVSFNHIEPDARECGKIRKPLIVNQDGVIYQGHCRLACAKHLGFETVPVIVVDDTKLSDEEKLDLLLDHSSERPLSKAEAFLAYSRWVNLGYGEKASFRKTRAILDLAFGPPSPEKLAIAEAVANAQKEDVEKAKEECAFSKHRGTVQNMYRLAKMPKEIQELYMSYWRTGKSDLTTADIKTLSNAFLEGVTNGRDVPEVEAEVIVSANALAEANRKEKEGSQTNGPKMRKKSDIEAMVTNTKLSQDARKALNWVLGTTTNEELLKS